MTNIGQVNAAVYRNFQMMTSKKLSELKIKNGQYDFFYVITLSEGISQKELSEHLHISKSTTAKAVKKLVAEGYVKKIDDEKDKRIDRLFLTELGKRREPEIREIFTKNIEIATKGFSDNENNQLLLLMNKVLDNLIAENKLNSEGNN